MYQPYIHICSYSTYIVCKKTNGLYAHAFYVTYKTVRCKKEARRLQSAQTAQCTSFTVYIRERCRTAISALTMQQCISYTYPSTVGGTANALWPMHSTQHIYTAVTAILLHAARPVNARLVQMAFCSPSRCACPLYSCGSSVFKFLAPQKVQLVHIAPSSRAYLLSTYSRLTTYLSRSPLCSIYC